MKKRAATSSILQRQYGISLVEILVALAISAFLIAGIIQILINNKQTYLMQEGLSRLQENARFAVDFMSKDIRQADYQGCIRSISAVQNLLDNPPASFTPELGIQGWEFSGGTGTAPGKSYDLNATDAAPVSTFGNNNGWSTSTGTQLDEIKAIRGSDILRVWGNAIVEGTSGAVLNIPASQGGGGTYSINVESSPGINAGDVIVLGDCHSVDILQTCDVVQQPQVPSTNLVISKSCYPGNQLNKALATQTLNNEFSQLTSGTYFIGKRDGKAANPPSLFYAPLNLSTSSGGGGRSMGTPQELIEGVDTMQILYGEDTDNDGTTNTYRTADQVANWNNIISVKISLLLRTTDEVDMTNTHGGVYDVNGTDINLVVRDRRPRKIYTTTIVLRNRVTEDLS